MFRLHKEITRLDIPAPRVLKLERSLSDVQVAMPGLPAQQATAYLCSFSSGQGVRVAVVLQLQTSGQLAFFLNEEGVVPNSDGSRIYNQGLGFAESMGFMFGDLDIHLKPPEERSALWDSLPLQSGVTAPSSPSATIQTAPPTAAHPTAAHPTAAHPTAAHPAAAPPVSSKSGKTAEPVSHIDVSVPPAKGPTSVSRGRPAPQVPASSNAVPAKNPAAQPTSGKPAGDPAPAPATPSTQADSDIPPAVSAGRAGTVSSRRPPSEAELAARRKELRENLGRFLASF